MAEKQDKTTNAPRPPVIAVMGHIDHGKSTLLDFIRQSNVVAGEAGGITQHISAYEVTHKTKDGQLQKITFLDTPGHAAFSGVRERGASIADIAILIVSAEEGVKEQTLEAYKEITETKTPFIVAINKIDRPNANIEKTKQQLADAGIFVESYGGKVPAVAISAKTGQGVDELLDMMLLVAEMEELGGNPESPAQGFVLETNLDPKIGVTATLIIKNGTLKVGDWVAVGKTEAKIKKIENFLGQTVTSASFSSPVRVYGFSTLPAAGQCFQAFADKKDLALYLAQAGDNSACQMFVHKNEGEFAAGQIFIPLIIKTDVYGSLEAVVKEVAKLNTEKIKLEIIQTGVGPITENDAKTASSSPNTVILGFHVKTDRSAEDLAAKFGFTIATFDIIYKLSEWLAEEIKKRTPKEKIEEVTGRAKILKLFSETKGKQIVGAQVTKGFIKKDAEVRIIRREVEVARGRLTGLQEQKIKVGQVNEGVQFGAELDSRLAVSPGDFLEATETILK